MFEHNLQTSYFAVSYNFPQKAQPFTGIIALYEHP